MSTNFTKAPWIVTTDWDSHEQWEVIEAEILPGKWGPVCDTLNRHHCLSPDDSAANASLIAAAPDLLDNCIKALAAWEGTGPAIMLDELRAAIAKAEGRQP